MTFASAARGTGEATHDDRCDDARMWAVPMHRDKVIFVEGKPSWDSKIKRGRIMLRFL